MIVSLASVLKLIDSRSTIIRTIKSSLNLLSEADQRKILVISVFQILLNILDLIGVALIGIVASFTISGIQSRKSDVNVDKLTNSLGIADLSFQSQISILSLSAVFVMILRTMFSMFLVKYTLQFLSQRGAELSSNLFSRLLAQPLQRLQKRSSQDYVYSLTFGVEVITLRIIAQAVYLSADISLLLLMMTALFVVNPLMAGITLITLGSVSVIIVSVTRNRVIRLGLESSVTEVQSRVQISETLSFFREIAVKDRQGFFLERFSQSRFKLANVLAQNNFMPFASKYIVESAIVISALFVAAIQFLISDAASAISTLAIFLAATTRIAPAVLRLQQSAIQINSGMGIASSTLMLIEELGDLTPVESTYTKFDQEHGNFEPRILIQKVTVTSQDKSVNLLRDVSLEISQGSRVGIVGASGAGKTTLVDLLLGLNTPTSGEVLISGKNPRMAIKIWPGSIAYVPQDVHLANGTIKENIALGYSANEVDESQIIYALELSGLSKFVNSLPNGLSSLVGDNGISLSGGQRQRIGLARALISKPRLLVLDEATSALDSQSEFEIAESIRNLGKEITVMVVAHRLSTIRDFERILYLKDGCIVAQGTFSEVRRMAKEFDEQASLMGF